jgi:hypothetical protein
MAFSSYLLNLMVLIYTGIVAGLVVDFIERDIALSAGASPDNSTSSAAAPAAMAASSGWTLLGCYTDSVSARSLPYGAGVSGGPTAMTNELCQSTCLAAGYTLAGTEYSDECCKYHFSLSEYGDDSNPITDCGNALQNGGAPAPDGNALCDMTCDGNTAETCGGPNRLTLYSYSSGGSTPSTYTLKATFDHTNFFSQMTFFTGGDPTHGYVDYLTQSAAQSAGLINTNNNQTYMDVDYKTLNPSAGRASVRVSSNAVWTHGLFIADIAHMPGGNFQWGFRMQY